MSNDAVSSPALMLSHRGCDGAVRFGGHGRKWLGSTPRTKARWPSTLTAPAATVWILWTPATRRMARSCFALRVCVPVTSRVASTRCFGLGTAVTDSLMASDAELPEGASAAGAGAEGRDSVLRCLDAARDLCGWAEAPWRGGAPPGPVAKGIPAGGKNVAGGRPPPPPRQALRFH